MRRTASEWERRLHGFLEREPLPVAENLDACLDDMLGMVADLQELTEKLRHTRSELGQLRHKYLMLMDSSEPPEVTRSFLRELDRLRNKLRDYEHVVPRCPLCGGGLVPATSLTSGQPIMACQRMACSWNTENPLVGKIRGPSSSPTE